MGSAAAYWHILAAQVRSQAQYRTSFALDLAGSVLFGILDIASILVLFRVVRTIGGFAFTEVLLMATLASTAFALADVSVGNLERVRVYVRSGLLDPVLGPPLGVLAQLTVQSVLGRGEAIIGSDERVREALRDPAAAPPNPETSPDARRSRGRAGRARRREADSQQDVGPRR